MDINNQYGLVLCGGNSSRMGVDKSMLQYHGMEHRYYIYKLLNRFCRSTFMSCNVIQASNIDTGYEIIVDNNTFAGNGPISGILSAFQRFPKQNFVVVGCDYPYLDTNELAGFLKAIPKVCDTAAFYNVDSALYEPVLGFYSYRSGSLLKQYFKQGKTSLQRFLQTYNAFKYLPGNTSSIQSIDSYDKYLQVLKAIPSNANVSRS